MENRTFKSLDIVIPVYNEAGVIGKFYDDLSSVLQEINLETRIFLVNDGSNDETQSELEALSSTDSRITVVELSRNFGHQAALTAGLEQSTADLVVSMDGDGQNPPAYLPAMITQAERGCDVVLMQRIESKHQTSIFKRLTSKAFYKMINMLSGTSIPDGAADFRLMTRPALDALISLGEYNKFLRGMVSWIGFPMVVLPFQLEDRLEGKSKYSLTKMLRLAESGVVSFSLRPLYFLIGLGLTFILFAGVEAVYVLSFWLRGLGHTLAPGWSSLMFVILIVGGSIIISLGVLGIYLGHIFQEVKRRPAYIIKQVSPEK